MNKTHAIRTTRKHTHNHQQNRCNQDSCKNIYATINKTNVIRIMQKHTHNHQQNTSNQDHAKAYMQLSTKTHAIRTCAKTWIHTNKIMEDKLSSANLQFWKLSKNEYSTFQVLAPSTWGWICTTQLLIMPCPSLKCLFFIMLTNLSSHGIFPKPSGALGLLLVLVLVLLPSCTLCFSHARLLHALDRALCLWPNLLQRCQSFTCLEALSIACSWQWP